MAPVITPDEANASVTVTPQDDSDKMTVHYVAPNGDAKEVIATKVGNQWTLNEIPTGISIDNTNGVVTVSYQGIQNGSEVSASKHMVIVMQVQSKSKCTSERSNADGACCYQDEVNASVTVIPQGDADKMTVHYIAPNGDPRSNRK